MWIVGIVPFSSGPDGLQGFAYAQAQQKGRIVRSQRSVGLQEIKLRGAFNEELTLQAIVIGDLNIRFWGGLSFRYPGF